MSQAFFFKVGFLAACADRGLDPFQAEILAARIYEKKASLLGSTANALMTAPIAGVGLAAGAGTLLGAGAGKMVNSMNESNLKMNETEERTKHLQALIKEVQRRKQLVQTNQEAFA